MYKPRVVIFGSTKEEIHIGCNALSDGLENLIKTKVGEDVIIQHVSHKFMSPIFYKNLLHIRAYKKSKYRLFSPHKFKIKINNSFNGWYKAYNELSNDIYLKLTILNADIVIINVEGIIHHEAVFGHQLLAIGKMAVMEGKEVYWVNFSTEDENNEILKHALKGAAKIAVRELKSYAYLKSMGIEVSQSFDTAILANFGLEEDTGLTSKKIDYCLFTGSNVKEINLKSIADKISKFGLEPIYLPMGLNDFEDLKMVRKYNIKHFNYGEVNLDNVLSIIDNAKLVISGRHHLNIFCSRVAKPFIPFKSNTWKVEGVCEMLSIKTDFENEISERIENTINHYSEISSSMRTKRTELISYAKNNI